MEPLQAFREIEIPIHLRDGIEIVKVPFNVELLFRAEQTIQKSSKRHWWRIQPKDESIVEAMIEFCEYYLPANFDYSKADPTFPALFFSSVKSELNASINNCMTSMNSMEEHPEHTEDKKTPEGSDSV